VGSQLAGEFDRSLPAEAHTFPESVGLTIWGTSAMRTHGDDIAQCLALLGVRPVWQAGEPPGSGCGRYPLAELGRPRIDVLMRISGFFRDAFPQLIELMDKAVQLVAHLDEPTDQNFVRKHYLHDLAAQIAKMPPTSAVYTQSRYGGQFPYFWQQSRGAYGGPVFLPLITSRTGGVKTDLAEAYINWGDTLTGRKCTVMTPAKNSKRVLSGGASGG